MRRAAALPAATVGGEAIRAEVVGIPADAGEAEAGPRTRGTWADLRAAVAEQERTPFRAGRLELTALRRALQKLGAPATSIAVALANIPVCVPPCAPRDTQRSALPSPELAKALRSAVECELLVPALRTGVVCSHHFVTPKRDLSWRLISDLREVNVFLDPERFRLVQLRKLPGSVKKYMASADLTKAFWQLPVDPASQHLLGVEFDDQTLVYQGLPMGLSISPLILQRITDAICAGMRSQGIWIVGYLDDFLLSADTEQELLHACDVFVEFCRDAGLRISGEKSEFSSNTELEFLGIIVNPTAQTFSVPPARLERITNHRRPHGCYGLHAHAWLRFNGSWGV